MADPVTAASAVIGAALLALQLKKEADEKKDAQQPAAGGAVPVFLPQPHVGPVDQGGAQPTPVPPDVTRADLLNLFAKAGRAHEAAPVINIYSGTTPPEFFDPYTTTPPGSSDAPTSPAPMGPLDSFAPVRGEPLQSTPEKPATHQDVLGRTQPGAPSGVELLKPLGANVGSMVLEAVGTARASVIEAATRGKGAGAFTKAGGAAPAALAGVGLGLQITSALQEWGAFDAVKDAGARHSASMGEKRSRAVATAALPLTVPGAAAKALVTPGESVVGNIYTAAEKSYIPQAVAGVKSVASEATKRAGELGAVVAAVSPSKVAATVAPVVAQTTRSAAGGKIVATVATTRQAAGDVGHKINQGADAARAVVGDLGHKFNQGAAQVGGLFSRRWF